MAINIFDTRTVKLPMPFDSKLYNYYLDESGSAIKIESIAEYLQRVKYGDRSLGSFVAMAIPKEGFSVGTFPIEYFSAAAANFDNKWYTFKGGIEDENFVEVIFGTQADWDETDVASQSYINNKPTIPDPQVQSDWNQNNPAQIDYIKNKPTIPDINQYYLKDWIEFEFRDLTRGIAQEYVLDIKALVPYNMDAVVLQTNDGTLTGVNIKINNTVIMGLEAITVTTDIVQTDALGDNMVVIPDKVSIFTTTGFTGSPTLIRGKLNLTRI